MIVCLEGVQEGESWGRERRKGGSVGWMRVRLQEKDGGARGRGKAEEGVKMFMHANFIILLINFSSSNPPAGT